MQANLLWVFLVIVILICLGALGVFLYVRSLNKKFEELKEQFKEVQDLPIKETLTAVKKMHLIGVSQTSLEEWETKYHKNEADSLEMENDFAELAETINNYSHIKHSKEFLVYLEDQLADLKAESQDIYEGLHKLKASEKQNSERIESSVTGLENLLNSVKESEDSFGIALPEVNKQLIQVKQTFDEFKALNENGDPVEAAKVVRKAERELEVVTELCNVVPVLNDELVIFKDQIQDLTEGYHKLKKRKFNFNEEDGTIDEKINTLKADYDELLDSLKRCDIEVVASGNRRMRQNIEHLYNVMQNEVDAETYVSSTQSVVKEFVDHAYKNNRQLTIELDHASQSFVFHENELGRVRNFQHEIERIQIENDNFSTKLEQKRAIFTEVEMFYKQALSVLEDIENQQVEMDQTVVKMGNDLKEAEKAFDYFEFKMRVYKRFVEKHRLPGLPEEYLDYFFLVTDHIERLGVELGKIRVDTILLNDYIEKINQEVEDVKAQTIELIDHASLAEQYMQYASRYRNEGEMQDILDEAMTLFDEYQYTEAMNTVKVALSKIEPEAISRIDEFYENEKEVLN